ncbi:MAG: hypothetical protein RLZZ04_2138 [Cyanobacteriota bacterium]|jgi:uncharacterized phage-associated protein
MKPHFNEKKSTQVATLLLKLRGGKMCYMKLIKLMYIVDRTALLEWGRPVTYDHYVSMPHGPVLSNTLDRINEGASPNSNSYWLQHISSPSGYDVHLIKEKNSYDELSEAEEELIQRIFGEFGHWYRWNLVEYLHENTPEWQDPEGSSIPIEYHDILLAGGKTEAEAKSIELEMENLAMIDALLS